MRLGVADYDLCYGDLSERLFLRVTQNGDMACRSCCVLRPK
jgi:hypothetical protein